MLLKSSTSLKPICINFNLGGRECVFSEIPENFYLILRQISYFSGTAAHIKEQNCENADLTSWANLQLEYFLDVH